jgi:hypothetical protein
MGTRHDLHEFVLELVRRPDGHIRRIETGNDNCLGDYGLADTESYLPRMK